MSEDEKTECRLTYAEGKEISRRISTRHYLRGMTWICVGCIVQVICVVIADHRFGVLWQGVSVLKEKALQGDMQALFDYLDHGAITSAGSIFLLAFGILAMWEMVSGEMKIKKALKEANEGKE